LDHGKFNAGLGSPAYLKPSVKSLEKILPRAKHFEFPGLDHGGSSNPGLFDRHGNPAIVARELQRFFA